MAKWHAVAKQKIADELKTDLSLGLTQKQARERILEFGPNELEIRKKKNVFHLFFSELKSPLVQLLLFAAFVTFFLGQFTDPLVIFSVILLNGLMGTVQEFRAEKALSALQNLSPTQVRVIREGEEQLIARRDLTVGDLLVLREGDLVGADARLLSAEMLKIDESTLTGESLAIDKQEAVLSLDTERGDRDNLVYAGTYVVSGRGLALVTAIGRGTEIGKIAALALEAPEKKTPIEERIALLGKQVAWVAFFLFFVLVLTGYLRQVPIIDVVLAAISQIVSFVPEGLPVSMTIALAVGVQKMAKKGAIIRQLVAVETLGSTDVICSDKTGTLTCNQMQVKEFLLPEGSQLEELLQAGVLCTDALIDHTGKGIGDPTEIALLLAGRVRGIEKGALLFQTPRIGEIPFDAKEKMMVTVHQKGGARFAIAKGAWESIATLLSQEYPSFTAQIEQLAAEGLRLLAVAKFECIPKELSFDALRGQGALLGVFAQEDPLRPEAKDAVAACIGAGIRPLMITGDHRKTAFAIAKQAGIASSESEVIEGKDLEKLTLPELEQKIDGLRVFARVYPEQKLAIVEALQRKGHIVAMTGDGVNDSPALARSDIGVAMGRTGSEVAKEVSKMVITDDNFATIVAAIQEGRVVFSNVKKVVSFLFTTSLAPVVLLFLAICLALPIPIAAVQILWINVVAEGVVTVNLILDPEEGDEMSRPPVHKKEPLFSKTFYIRLFTVTSIITFLLLGNFLWLQERGASLVQMQTETFTLLAICAWLNVLNCRSETRSVFANSLFHSPLLTIGLVAGILLQSAVIYIPWMQQIFHTEALSVFQLIKLTALGCCTLWVEEARKTFVRYRTSR